MSAKINPQQDKKDFEKYTKFLIYKSVQIIVQSRLGEKIKTKSKPFSSGADWFNLAVTDNNEVQAEAKKVLSGQSAILSQSVCVEISLRTAEGDTMVLESWYITLDSNQCDIASRVSYTVYNRMSIALKSLLSVSRVTPAYKLSRKQGTCAADYVICYRIYLGEPQYFFLGDRYEKSKVGSVPTPYGTINIILAYRTKLLISPQKAGKEVPFEVKDDHFKQDSSPRRPTTPKPCSQGYRRSSTSDTDGSAQSEELCSTTFSTSPSGPSPQRAALNPSHHQSQPIKINQGHLSPEIEETKDIRPQSAPEKPSSFKDYHRVGAFAQQPSKGLKEIDEVPFLSLLQPKVEQPKLVLPESAKVDGSKANSSTKTESSINTNTSESACSDSKTSVSSQASAPDDFVMVELKTPFAGPDANSDLGRFYRECQGAPSLAMCEDERSVGETLDQITNQLDVFETNMTDFDDFVASLQDVGESTLT